MCVRARDRVRACVCVCVCGSRPGQHPPHRRRGGCRLPAGPRRSQPRRTPPSAASADQPPGPQIHPSRGPTLRCVQTKHSQEAGPFSVARLKMDLHFHSRLSFTGGVPALFIHPSGVMKNTVGVPRRRLQRGGMSSKSSNCNSRVSHACRHSQSKPISPCSIAPRCTAGLRPDRPTDHNERRSDAVEARAKGTVLRIYIPWWRRREQTSRRADEQTSRRADEQTSRRADEQQTSRRAKRAWKESVTTTIIKNAHISRARGHSPGCRRRSARPPVYRHTGQRPRGKAFWI